MLPLPFSPSASLIHRLRRITPRLLRRLPRPRWAIRRCTHCTTADGQPLMSTSSGLRLTARRGRLTLKPQADLRDTPVGGLRQPTPLCAVHSKPPTLLWLSHLRFAQHRHHRPSPHSAPRLDRCICVKGRVVLSCALKSASGISTRTAAILPRIGGGGSAYSEGARGGSAKMTFSAVGGVQSHNGGKPPNPLTRYHSVQTQLQAATKSRIL